MILETVDQVLALTPAQRKVVFAVTLAQIEDVHVVLWSLTPQECELAETMLGSLDGLPAPRAPLANALRASLAVLVHDIDHPDLAETEWAILDEVHHALSREFQPRLAKVGDR